MPHVPSRCFIRVSAFLVGVLIMAQSNATSLSKGDLLVSQANGLPFAQAPHLEVSTNFSQTAQAAPFALRGARVSKGVRTRSVPGLDFAAAVTYSSGGFSGDG